MRTSLLSTIAGAVLVLAACSPPSPVGEVTVPETSSTAVSDQVPSTSPTSEAPSSTSSAPTDSASDEEDSSEPGDYPSEVGGAVVDFVASLDDLLADSEYQAALAEDPEVFVATGLLFCEQLDSGETPSDLLGAYIETFTDGTIDEAEDGVLDLAGWLLGAAVGNLCPEHTAVIEELSS